MAKQRYDDSHLNSIQHLIGYFDQQVLAGYRNEPHKFKVESDFFEGNLSVTNEYFQELEEKGKTDESVSIRFGYRTLRDGNLALVAWLPDVVDKSKAHTSRWAAFHLKNPEWMEGYDERFGNWVLRHLEGSWQVDNGPLDHLAQTIKIINALTYEIVGKPLFKYELDRTLGYPAAENTHRYQDAHKVLYGYLIDGLNKECISALANNLGKTIRIGDKRAVRALSMLFPELEKSEDFGTCMVLISKQRGLAAHGVRPKAENFSAFSAFTSDLDLCLRAERQLLTILEDNLNYTGASAEKRHEAKKWLAHIGSPPEANYSINAATRMKGKTVEKVEVGSRVSINGVHESEAIIIYFTDGSIISIDTGSNAHNIATDVEGLQESDFHVDFNVHWVPPLEKKMGE